jgi:Spy/CpxP family protein refolding chaperone
MRTIFAAALAVAAVSLGLVVQGAASMSIPLAFESVPPVMLIQYKSPLQIECEERGKRRGFDGGEFQNYVRRCMER